MAYLNQPWFNREIINRFAMATGVVHSETLSVIKRASGQPQQTPVTPVEVDGVKYTVSTRGESQWVKNVRVDPNVTLTTKIQRHEIRRHRNRVRAWLGWTADAVRVYHDDPSHGRKV